MSEACCGHYLPGQVCVTPGGVLNCPHAMRNLPRGTSLGSISGLEFLKRLHSKYNPNNPFNVARRNAPPVFVQPAAQIVEKRYPKKRVKKLPPAPDADGKYHL